VKAKKPVVKAKKTAKAEEAAPVAVSEVVETEDESVAGVNVNAIKNIAVQTLSPKELAQAAKEAEKTFLRLQEVVLGQTGLVYCPQKMVIFTSSHK